MRIRSTILAFGLVLALAGPALAELVERDFQHTFPVEKGTMIRVDHGDGDVTLTPWDKNEVDVVVKYRAEETKVGFGEKQELEVEFRESDGVVHIVERRSGGVTVGFQSREIKEYTYTIRGPSHLAVELEGEDGEVRIEGWQAEIDATLEDGSIYLSDVKADRTRIQIEDGDAEIVRLEGELVIDGEDGDITVVESNLPKARIRTEDGGVVVRETTGSLDLEVEDGDVRLSGVRAENLDVRSEDGDVELDLLRGERLTLDVTAEDGSVYLSLEPGVSAMFTVRTGDGGITLDLPDAKEIQQKEGRVSGQMGDGKGLIQIQTDAGDITLRESRRRD